MRSTPSLHLFGYDFHVATFGHGASFSEATFGADFSFARFVANFTCAIFDNSATFVGTTFGADANFAGAAFGHGAQFIRATFCGEAHLRALAKGNCQLKLSTLLDHYLPFSAWPEKRKEEFLATYEALLERGAGPDGFGSISFANAHFGSRVYFAGRKFFSHGDFTGASFAEPPTFDRCENTGRLNLYGARITFSGTLFGFIPEWTTDSDVGIRLRLLRKIADETQNHDLERDLYILERKAERGIKLGQYWSRWKTPAEEGDHAPEKSVAKRSAETVLVVQKLLAHCLWIAINGCLLATC